jgi:hypothetical protein
MDYDTIVRWGLLCGALLCGCVAEEGETGDTDGDTDAVATSAGLACQPGSTLACACNSGAMGTQACAPDGQSYGMCECGDAESSSSSTTSGPPTGDPTGDPTGETDDGDTTTDAESSTSGGSTSAAECEAGEAMECDCGSGPGVATCSDGQFGACECCMGAHPLVDGDMRYCEEDHCYCGDLQMKPPLDVCYAEAIADACCPIELECY